MADNVYLAGYGQTKNTKESFQQANPLESNYSPRLFGSPPQLSNLCDMRIDSGVDGHEGATGDWYRNNVLKPAQIAHFMVGHAQFTGGYSSILDTLRQMALYLRALNRYDIYDNNGALASGGSYDWQSAQNAYEEKYTNNLEKYPRHFGGADEDTVGENVSEWSEELSNALDISTLVNNEEQQPAMTGEDYGNYEGIVGDTRMSYNDWGVQNSSTNDLMSGDNKYYMDAESVLQEASGYVGQVGNSISGATALATTLWQSLSMNQPFYTFANDWYSYINNVKMMINTAIVMLGLQQARVRIGDKLIPIGTNVKYSAGGDDVWNQYRYITSKDVTAYTSIDTMNGDTDQYVSFMIEPTGYSEGYTNNTGESKLFSVMNAGSAVGNEIAFMANATRGVVDDAIIKLAAGGVSVAENIISTLGGGIGRFTASFMGGLAKSWVGDHPIYPKVFQQHTSTGSMTVNVKLRASRGDVYSYFTEVLVPLFFIMGMALPKMSDYSAGAYQYPPLVQCNIPGLWGTRLGIVSNISVSKNPDGSALSVHGFPLSINVGITIEDLQHCLVTTPMDKPAFFLNNNTMFDYIGQCCGVDKYRYNPGARMATKLALAGSFVGNGFYHLGNSIANDFTTLVNKYSRISQF